MKRFFLFSIFLGLSTLLFAQNDTIAGWTFPDLEESSLLANFGADENIQTAKLKTESSERPIKLMEFDEHNVASSDHWQNIANLKFWKISLDVSNYTNITVSSNQRSTSTLPGPEFFKLQYKLENNPWTDIDNSTLQLADNWEAANYDGILLPEECDNYQGTLEVRWIATSDTLSNGISVEANGVSYIKNIFIKGEYTPLNLNPVLVGWEFGELWGSFDPTPSHGITSNLGHTIKVYKENETDTSAISYGGVGYTNGCASISGWEQGENKMFWMIQLSTKDYVDIELSSRQRSEEGGPASFELQYKIGDAEWKAIDNGSIALDSEWETGNTDRLTLPEECEDSDQLISIRWIMNSSDAVEASSIDPEAASIIDEIFVYGYSTTNENEFIKNEMKLYPVPCQTYLQLNTVKEMTTVRIFNLSGQLLDILNPSSSQVRINTTKLNPGIFILQIENQDGQLTSKRFIKN